MASISPDTVIARGDKHVETDVGDQVMMMSIQTGKYYALEGTARTIWAELETPLSVTALVDALVGKFSVDKDTCMKDVMVFLQEMSENELVVEHKNAAGS